MMIKEQEQEVCDVRPALTFGRATTDQQSFKADYIKIFLTFKIEDYEYRNDCNNTQWW